MTNHETHNTAAPGWRVLAEQRSRSPAGYLRLITRTYSLPDGSVAKWDLLDGGRTVAVLALTPGKDVLLVRQFRPGPSRTLDEMPGGYLHEDESPAAGAVRELLTETGYAGKVEIVASTWLSASATTERFVAIATGCSLVGNPRPDPGEFCEPVVVSLADFRHRLRSGQLTDVDAGYLALDHADLLQGC